MLKSIIIGLLLSMVTVGIHAVGTEWLIHHFRKRESLYAPPLSRLKSVKLLCGTAVALLVFHVVEVAVWASVYLIILSLDPIHTIEEATYFSMGTFSALGYGDIVITESWRVLSGIQAMTGVLVFGWSTALLFAVVRALWISEEP